MSKLKSPSQIRINFPGSEVVARTISPMVSYTTLFREDANLPEVLGLAQLIEIPEADLAIISAGCSNGAEVDSILALCYRNRIFGGMAIAGLDNNPVAINEAKKGRYELGDKWQYGYFSTRELRRTLDAYGFVVREEEYAKETEPEAPTTQLIAEAYELRKNHEVNFKEADLLEGAQLPQEPADIIFANNMLIYHHGEKAITMARHFADMLKDKGIISFGEESLKGEDEWQREIARMYQNEFNLKILRGKHLQPVAFYRK